MKSKPYLKIKIKKSKGKNIWQGVHSVTKRVYVEYSEEKIKTMFPGASDEFTLRRKFNIFLKDLNII